MKKHIVVLAGLLAAGMMTTGVMAEEDSGAKGQYVLMNIPYEQFYEADVTDSTNLDAVTSATLMKSRDASRVGGSYHSDSEGALIEGTIFPVYVEDLEVLKTLGGEEMTDDSSVSITIELKGEEQTDTYEGKAALFEAPAYSWYVLDEEPAQYKVLETEDGSPSFGPLVSTPETVEGTASFGFDKHTNILIQNNSEEFLPEEENVTGAILTTEDGTAVGLRHMANIWKKNELGIDSSVYEALKGQTITKITWITENDTYVLPVDLYVTEDELMSRLSAAYIELFPEFAKEEYKDYWMECIGEYVDDEETAEEYYSYLTANFMSTLKGEEAVKAAEADPENLVFNCFFENDLAKIVINGNTISGEDADGNVVFSHAYTYLEDQEVTFFGEDMGVAFHVYESEDADDKEEGETDDYRYFAFSDDTLADTQHIEFRYGPSLDNLASYSEGEYAYWLAAGIQENYKEGLIQDCIKLFVDENLGEEVDDAAETDEQAAAQADETGPATVEQAAGEVIEIATAEDLACIRDNLSGNYILTADIDIEGAEWSPIGGFVQMGEEGEEAETPNPEYAFTGTFDGNGHTISNFVITGEDGICIGLFGCIANAQIGNFTVENASTEGTVMVSDVVGYSYCSTVKDIVLKKGTVTAYASEYSEEGMYGGIVGAGMASTLENCDADADIVIPDGTANAGIVGGGLEVTSLSGCRGTGTVTAGNDCYGIGGVSGCGFGAEEITACTAENVVIQTGDNCYWIGGISGYAGGYDLEEAGIPVTNVDNCTVKDVEIETGENADGVDTVIGAGFFMEGLAEMYGDDMYANPTEFVITNADVSRVTVNGEAA